MIKAMMAGGNETQRSDRILGRSMRSLRFVPACHAFLLQL
jgi:hypothetical protein